MARQSASDKKLNEIKDLLFPTTKVEETVENGEKFKYMVDYSVDNNLYAVLIDLQEGVNDKTCHKTINNCINVLLKVRNILEAHMYLEKDAKYITVGMPDVTDVENIQ